MATWTPTANLRGPIGLTGSTGSQGIQGPVGPAGLQWRGNWSAAADYAVNEAVTYNGSSYRRKVAGTTATTPDVDTSNWDLIASKGDTGTAPSDVVSKTLVDAKGDLIVGTANDAVSRQPLGTDGHVLVADANTTTGVKWTAPSALSAGAGGYGTIQDEGTAQAQRTTLNFIGSAITATDDLANLRTNVTVDAAPATHTHTKSQVTDFAHTHPASELTATGTRDATTFLRGDNTWAAPAAGGGTSGVEFDLTADNVSTQPVTPPTGITLFARHRARRTLAYVGPQGQDTSLQPAMFSNRISTWNALNNSTAAQTYGLAVTGVGTGTAVAPVSTSFFGGMVRMRYASSTTAGNAAGLRTQTTQWFLSSTANLGGFFMVARWGMNQVTTTNRVFVGLHTGTASTTAAASGVMAGGTEPTALLNTIGFGCNAAQTTLRFMHNDATGAATSVDLGTSFPATTAATNFYETRLFAPSGGGQSVHWSITRLNDGTVAQGTATTDLPALGTMLASYVHHSNGTTAAAVHMDIQSLYIESDN